MNIIQERKTVDFKFSIGKGLLYNKRKNTFFFGNKQFDNWLPSTFNFKTLHGEIVSMNLNINKLLISRPAGKDAFLTARAYVFNSLKADETINLDFIDVKVLTPSWIDEFIFGIRSNFKNKITYFNTTNESVPASLKTVLN